MLLFMFTCISAFSNLSANLLQTYNMKFLYNISMHRSIMRVFIRQRAFNHHSLWLVILFEGNCSDNHNNSQFFRLYCIYLRSKYGYFIWAYTVIIGKWFYGRHVIVFFSGGHFMEHFDIYLMYWQFFHTSLERQNETSNGFHLFFCSLCLLNSFFFFF